MRLRSVLSAVAAVLLVPVLAAPAQAGTGVANWCSDGVTGPGGVEILVLNGPITVGIEIDRALTDTGPQRIRVCFSDSAPGEPSRLVGGEVSVFVGLVGGTAAPEAFVALECIPDLGPTGVFPTCWQPVGAIVALDDIAVSTPDSAFCLVSIGPDCVRWLPGVQVDTDHDPSRPLLALNLLGIPVTVQPPVPCIALVVAPCSR
jgi:hypothetical protein